KSPRKDSEPMRISPSRHSRKTWLNVSTSAPSVPVWFLHDSEHWMVAEMDILDAVSIRLPCNACGQTYQVPLRDVLLSHTIVQCGCPVSQETECPPVYQIRLFDREPIRALSSAWKQLTKRARADGGELVISEASTAKETLNEKGAQSMAQDHEREGRIRQPVPTSGPLLSFDLGDEVRRLQSEQPWQAEHTANTIVK